MSRSKLVPLVKSLLPDFPGFAVKGRMLFVAPIEQILQGILFEPSAFGGHSSIETFVMPLCVPMEFIHFSFRESAYRHDGKGYGWPLDEPGIVPEIVDVLQTQALPFLQARSSLQKFLAVTPPSTSWHPSRNVAYSLARLGRVPESLEVLDRILTREPDDRAWEIAFVAQVRAFRTKLIADPSAALRQLIAWEAETIDNLGLTKFRQV